MTAPKYNFPIEKTRPIFGQGAGQFGCQVACTHKRGERMCWCSCWFSADDDEMITVKRVPEQKP